MICRAFYLQFLNVEQWQRQAEKKYTKYVEMPAIRGKIFDRNGELLADNQPIFNLTVVREQVDDLDQMLNFLATLIRLNDDDIDQFNARLERNRVPFASIPLRYVLTEEEKSRIAVNSHLLNGVAIEPQFVRHYPLSLIHI